MLHITINGKGQITNDTLHELKVILERNRPKDECDFPTVTLVRQTLDLAVEYLKKSHVFEGTFPDGSLVIFTGERLPPGVTEEQLVATALKTWANEALAKGELR